MEGASVGPTDDSPTVNVSDEEETIKAFAKREKWDAHLFFKMFKMLRQHDELFYENVTLDGKVSVSVLLDSGSMACTLSATLVPQLLQQGVITSKLEDTNAVLIVCGGSRTVPVGVCDREMEMYG